MDGVWVLRMYFNLKFFPYPTDFDAAVRRFKELSYSKKSNTMYTVFCVLLAWLSFFVSLFLMEIWLWYEILSISLKTLYRKTSLKRIKSEIHRASHLTVLILFSSWFPPSQSSYTCLHIHCSLYICASRKLITHFKIKEELFGHGEEKKHSFQPFSHTSGNTFLMYL